MCLNRAPPVGVLVQRPRVRQPGPHRAREEPDQQAHQRDVGVQDRGDNPRPRRSRGYAGRRRGFLKQRTDEAVPKILRFLKRVDEGLRLSSSKVH